MSHVHDWLEWILTGMSVLILGSYGYTRTTGGSLHRRVDNLATKEDVKNLKDKVCNDNEEIKKDIRLIMNHLLNEKKDQA